MFKKRRQALDFIIFLLQITLPNIDNCQSSHLIEQPMLGICSVGPMPD